MRKPRKHFTAEEKVAILRRHLLEQEPVSKLCDESGLQPTVFYRWQKEFFENGVAAFGPRHPSGQVGEQPGVVEVVLDDEQVHASIVGRRAPARSAPKGFSTTIRRGPAASSAIRASRMAASSCRNIS